MEAVSNVLHGCGLYGLAFMDHPCTQGTTVSHHVSLSTLYSTPGNSEYEQGVQWLKIFST